MKNTNLKSIVGSTLAGNWKNWHTGRGNSFSLQVNQLENKEDANAYSMHGTAIVNCSGISYKAQAVGFVTRNTIDFRLSYSGRSLSNLPIHFTGSREGKSYYHGNYEPHSSEGIPAERRAFTLEANLEKYEEFQQR